MIQLIKGIPVKLYDLNGNAETVENVLVGEPTSAASTDLSENSGEVLTYTLAIPKGDSHEWISRKVEFFGRKFRTVGYPIQGIEANIPLSWNMKIKAELLVTNGSITFYEKKTLKKHVFRDVYFYDNRSEKNLKDGTQKNGEISVKIYAVNNPDLISSLQSMTHEEMSVYTHEELVKMSGAYMPKPGDYAVYGECDFTFTADADQKQISAELAQFREANPKYAAVVASSCIAYGSLPDIVITAR